MKTAISLPDETFDRATRRAAELGMSRSEFFARAADHYLDSIEAATLTDRINAALDHIGPTDSSSHDAVRSGRHVLANTEYEW